MSALLDKDPAYKAVKIIKVDWDRFGRAAIVKQLRIPRRSTLVMFKGGKEVGRVVASTSMEDIEPLFKAAI